MQTLLVCICIHLCVIYISIMGTPPEMFSSGDVIPFTIQKYFRLDMK